MDKNQKFVTSENFWKKESSKFSSLYNTKNIKNIPNKIFLYKRIKTIESMINQNKNGKALDVGCGSGEFTVLLKKYFNEVVGIDYSDEMIEVAKKYDVKNEVNFKYGDCTKIEYPDNTFDYLFALGLLDYVNDLDAVILELKRVLKKDGKLIITIPKNPTIFFLFRFFNGLRYKLFDAPPIVNALNKIQLYKIFENNGFSITKIHSLWTTTWIVELKKLIN